MIGDPLMHGAQVSYHYHRPSLQTNQKLLGWRLVGLPLRRLASHTKKGWLFLEIPLILSRRGSSSHSYLVHCSDGEELIPASTCNRHVTGSSCHEAYREKHGDLIHTELGAQTWTILTGWQIKTFLIFAMPSESNGERM